MDYIKDRFALIIFALIIFIGIYVLVAINMDKQYVRQAASARGMEIIDIWYVPRGYRCGVFQIQYGFTTGNISGTACYSGQNDITFLDN